MIEYKGRPFTNREILQMSGEEIQRYLDEGRLQFADLPTSCVYWAWRETQK